MFGVRIEVDETSPHWSRLCPTAGSRIAFNDLPDPLRSNLESVVRHYLDKTIVIHRGTEGAPMSIVIDGNSIDPEDLKGSEDAFCILFQAAWWGSWQNLIKTTRWTCPCCEDPNAKVIDRRCNNPECNSHMMTNDILGPPKPRAIRATG
jgi:hypothetical protein